MTSAPDHEEYVRALEETVKALQTENHQLKQKVDELLRELGSGK